MVKGFKSPMKMHVSYCETKHLVSVSH